MEYAMKQYFILPKCEEADILAKLLSMNKREISIKRKTFPKSGKYL